MFALVEAVLALACVVDVVTTGHDVSAATQPPFVNGEHERIADSC